MIPIKKNHQFSYDPKLIFYFIRIRIGICRILCVICVIYTSLPEAHGFLDKPPAAGRVAQEQGNKITDRNITKSLVLQNIFFLVVLSHQWRQKSTA